MIKASLKKGVNVILLTPSPDQRINILEKYNDLEKHAKQIIALSKEYSVGLIDSYELFRQKVISGDSLSVYMSQVYHPTEKGNLLIANEIMKYCNYITSLQVVASEGGFPFKPRSSFTLPNIPSAYPDCSKLLK